MLANETKYRNNCIRPLRFESTNTTYFINKNPVIILTTAPTANEAT